MARMRHLAGMAVGALAGMAVGDGAEAASTTRSAYLHSGPGTGYSVVTTVPGGAQIGILGCGGNWCRASYGRWTGYVWAPYIAGAYGGGTNMQTSSGATIRLENRGSPPGLGLILQGGGTKKRQELLNNRSIAVE